MAAPSIKPEKPNPETPREWREFYRRLQERNASPLWESLACIVTPKPHPSCVPCLWRYDEMRPLLMESGDLITAREAERRVLILENPGLPDSRRGITSSLYAGLQLILPGEVARSHRHTASALRFIIEGDASAYTSVDGERTMMHPGDFILTPSWTFHDHGNLGQVPVVWLDGLDIPTVNFFDTSFAEPFGEEVQPVSRKEGDALARYGSNLMPFGYTPSRKSAPIFNYPYSDSREALERVYRNGPHDPRHGVKMQYVNPATGGYPLPTIAAFLQLMPGGFSGEVYRSTDATVYCVVEGEGRTKIGSATFDWKPKDLFVAPSWYPVSHEATSEAVLFSFSDRPAQQALGLWREG